MNDLKSIAIVGMAGRFAGAPDVDSYWQNLLNAQDCISTTDRWPEDPQCPVKGGFLSDVSVFDAPFFRISPNEAKCMDPQQRVLLEVMHHSIEDSGLSVEELRQHQCAVMVTSLPGDYKFLMAQYPELAFSTHSFLGNAVSSIAGRIAYFYDLHGPVITLDTACSSSLTAVQLACQSIQSGSCDMALVGAVSVFSTDEMFRLGNQSSMLSKLGRCATFDDSADGFTPAEGVAGLVLTTQEKAQSLGLTIYATIEALELNHDGASNGLTAPNAKAQQQLIENTYRKFDIDVGQIAYVETHGTGTKLGDPIEVKGLTSAFDSTKQPYDCYLGSSKSVIGHCLVASGLASMIKVMQSFVHKTITPLAHFKKANQHIDFGHFKINQQCLPWPKEKPLVAISAFGFTGSNAHMVLKMPEQRAPVQYPEQAVMVFPLSAQSLWSLATKVSQLSEWLADVEPQQLPGLSEQLCRVADFFDLRVVVIAQSKSQLQQGLLELTQLEQPKLLGALTLQCPSKVITQAKLEQIKQWLKAKKGNSIQWTEVTGCKRFKLPKYPFERRSYWIGEYVSMTSKAQQSPSTQDGLKQRQQQVASQIAATLADLMGFSPEQIILERSLLDYGVDSLSAIKVMDPFKHVVSDLGPQDIFRFDSIALLAEHIAKSAQGISTVQSQPKEDKQSKELASLGLMANLEVAADNVQWVYGQKPGRPLLLLPALNTSYRAWVMQLNSLQLAGWQPHIPIYPGHLDNQATTQQLDYRTLAGQIANYIKQYLEAKPVPVVGWSLGGCLAMLMALDNPELMQSMVLISTASRFQDDIFGKTIELQDELSEHQDMMDIVFGKGMNMADRIGAGASMNTLQHYYSELAKFDIATQMSKIHVSTLVINGKKDAVITQADVQRLSHIPQSNIKQLDEHGHFIPITAARQFNRLILSFLADGSIE